MEVFSSEFLTAIAQFGPLGLFIAYLVWRESTLERNRKEAEQERAKSDSALASALTALTVTISHLEQRMK